MPDPSLLRTHPPTETRIRRLLALKERVPVRPPLTEFGDGPAVRPNMQPVTRRPRYRWPGLWW